MYICPLPLELPSNLPLHPTPLGCHRALGLSSLGQAANSRWLAVLHTVMCMFQSCPVSTSLFIESKIWALVVSGSWTCGLCIILQCLLCGRHSLQAYLLLVGEMNDFSQLVIPVTGITGHKCFCTCCPIQCSKHPSLWSLAYRLGSVKWIAQDCTSHTF